MYWTIELLYEFFLIIAGGVIGWYTFKRIWGIKDPDTHDSAKEYHDELEKEKRRKRRNRKK